MVGELPIDGECSVCGGALESIEEQVEKKRNPFDEPKMYLETWKVTRCVECSHIEGKKLLSSEPLT
jgi:hypothetical protein